MYFFQDDIGLLVQQARNNFWQFLILPHAEHFIPLLHILNYLEFKLFNLNFYGYLFVSLFLHFANVALLYKTLRLLNLNKKNALIISLLFTVNLTFVEPLLWYSAQGVVLANIFVGLAFYFWLKRSLWIFVFLICASFSYSTGLGLGFIFGFLSLMRGKFIPAYFIVGLVSLFIGPLVAGNLLGQMTPQITSPFLNFLQFSAFVVGGVGRGVFARLFLPGLEPRHFEILKTLLSFIPFAVVCAIVTKIIISGRIKFSRLLLSLAVLIVYPYIWAGAIRYHFGIKQALAERYAYTSLFFTVILLGVLLKYFFGNKINKAVVPLALTVFLILVFQTFVFCKKAVEFEIRPLRTKKYIEELKIKYGNSQKIVDAPLPPYINQPLKVSDLYPILKPQ